MKTNFFDSDLENKNLEKNDGLSFLAEGKVEAIRSKNERGFDIATPSRQRAGKNVLTFLRCGLNFSYKGAVA